MNNIDNNAQTYSFADDEVSLKELLTPLWHRRWKIIILTLLVGLVVAFYMSLLKPKYQSSAILQIGSHISANTLSINDAFNNEVAASSELIQTQYEILKSRKFAERVVSQLNLVEHPEFRVSKYNNTLPFFADDNLAQKPSLSTIVSQFRSQLTISPITSTELVKITFRSYYPDLAAKVANYIGQVYLQYQDEIHSSTKDNTSQWLVEQLDELGEKLEASELALQQFRESEGVVDVNGISGLISNNIGVLTSESLSAEKYKGDLEIVYDFISANRNNINKLAELKEVNSHSTFIQFKKNEEVIERKVSELVGRYGPKHPKRIAVEAELLTIRANIDQFVNEQVQSIEKEYLSAIEKVKATDERLIKAKANFLRLNRLKNQFSQLQREVDTNQELYNNYLVRLKETDAMGNYAATFYVRFLDKAIVPKGPYAPRKSLMIFIALVLAFIGVSVYVVMRELLMDTLNSRRKLENFTEAPILAVLPRFNTKSSAKDEDKYFADGRFIEAVRTLRTSMLFNNDKTPPKVIAVTSSVPSEGKSTVALHLARSYSEMEKVLLIEADMRQPTVAKNLNLDPFRPGLSNLLAKTHQINECIIRDKHVKLDILTSGISPANPLAFLSMKRFDMLIKVFGNFYDRIVIETPPVNAVSDAVIISRLVESVLYVVHGTKTKREQITSGLRMLKQAKAPIEGIVINQSESIDTSRYQHKYYNERANIIKLPIRKQAN